MPRRSVPDPLSLAIGQRIRQLREAAGMTLEKLAYESELGSKGHLSDLERGLVRPTAHTLRTLSDHLGVELADVVTFPEASVRHAVIDATRRLSEEDLLELYRKLTGLEHPLLARNQGEGARAKRSPRAQPPFTVVRVIKKDRFRTSVPLFGEELAAGAFDPAYPAPRTKWVTPRTRRKLRAGMFVAQVRGESMEPFIANGAYALFDSNLPSDLGGRIVLVQYRGLHDAEPGATYTVKRFDGTPAIDEHGNRRWTRIRLRPDNPRFDPIELRPEDEAELKIVAVLLDVLGVQPT